MSLGFSLNDLLRAAVASETPTGESKPKRPVTEDIAALTAAAERYTAPIPFMPKQLVTPRANRPLKDAGRPHIVLEVDPDAQPYLEPGVNGKPDGTSFGQRLDMRVACTCDCDHGEIRAHWVESWMFEPYVAPEPSQAVAEAPASAA